MTHYIPEGLPDRIRHYIDGEFVDSVGGETFDVLDPVSNETYVRAAAGQAADVDGVSYLWPAESRVAPSPSPTSSRPWRSTASTRVVSAKP